MNNIIYKEDQKKARDGVMLDYPVTDVLINPNIRSVSVLIRNNLSPEEITNLVCEFNAQMFLADMTGKPPIGAGPVHNLKIDLEGDLRQLIESLVRAGWISRVTCNTINSYFGTDPDSEITNDDSSYHSSPLR